MAVPPPDTVHWEPLQYAWTWSDPPPAITAPKLFVVESVTEATLPSLVELHVASPAKVCGPFCTTPTPGSVGLEVDPTYKPFFMVAARVVLIEFMGVTKN